MPFPHAGRPVVDIDDVEGVVELILAKAENLEAVLTRLPAPPPPLAGEGRVGGAGGA